MKGGKGGQGRKRTPAKPVAKDAPRGGAPHGGATSRGAPPRGAPKRDWGAEDRDEPLPSTPATSRSASLPDARPRGRLGQQLRAPGEEQHGHHPGSDTDERIKRGRR